MKRNAPSAAKIALAPAGGGPLGAIHEIGALCALDDSLAGLDFTHALERLGAGLPLGIFSNNQIDVQLSKLFSRPGRTYDFRQLKTKLTLVATHWDSAESAPFGRPGWGHVLTSQAVQASAALPGPFPPVEIDDQYCVDGALKKTLHASVALEEGADLMLCLNPLEPFDAKLPQVAKGMPRGVPAQRLAIPHIVDGGLPAVLSQAFRSMIHSRMEPGKNLGHVVASSSRRAVRPASVVT